MFFIQLYYEQSPSVEPSKKPLRFEDLIDAFKPVELKEMGFQSLNFSLYITAFNEIRNHMVHSSLLDIQRKGQDGYLSVELPHKKRKGLFNDYLKSLFDDYKGKLICDNYLSVKDDRFLEFNFQLRISKKAKLDIPNSIVTYSSTISEIIKQSAGQLFLIAKWTTDQLLNDLS